MMKSNRFTLKKFTFAKFIYTQTLGRNRGSNRETSLVMMKLARFLQN